MFSLKLWNLASNIVDVESVLAVITHDINVLIELDTIRLIVGPTQRPVLLGK